MNTTIKIAKWALDNVEIKMVDGDFFAWIEHIGIYGEGDTELDAVFMAIRVAVESHEHYISNPESKFAGPALAMRKMFVELFGGGDE